MVRTRATKEKIDADIPTILVIFGATGDLIGKKILPSLFHLFEKGNLPDLFHVVGFSRRALSNKAFQRHLETKLRPHANSAFLRRRAGKFLKRFSYQRGLINKSRDYAALSNTLRAIDESWGVCTNKLFYLAVPPELYKPILQNLAHSGLTIACGGPNEGWTRVIVEKPFGKNLKTARSLDSLLGKLLNEEQIYRIDHYLAKEMLQNILTFRFANNLFERNWNDATIEKIEIRLLEAIGVEDRGNFYDGVGALRDVGQNHLLQVLALVTMEHPRSLEPKAIREARAKLLSELEAPKDGNVRSTTFRSQYRGYRSIKGVRANSQTETYFKIRAHIASPRWRGTLVTLESGKRLGTPVKEVVMHVRHPKPCLCPPRAAHHKNRIVIRLEPKEEIDVLFWSKRPGYGMETEERNLNFLLREKRAATQYTEEYEKLLLDCIAGNQMLFISTDEVEAMWRFTDPIVAGWEKNLAPLSLYHPDSKEIVELAEKEFAEQAPLILKREIGIIGLGKMGQGLARQLAEKGWKMVGYNRSLEKTKELEKDGVEGAYSLSELARKLKKPRVWWLMLPAGDATEEIIFGPDGIVHHAERGDIVIDAGNSFYKDSIRREKLLKKYGIRFLDVGVSGGPGGARNGASIMVGGDKKLYHKLEELFRTLSVPEGYGYMGAAGAGHFVKMIHNGIEYGMLQAIGEGFEVLKKSAYKLDLKDVARVYSRGTVIESRLINWLINALDIHGPDLEKVSGSVKHTGEGAWTVKTAKEEKVKVKIIEEALKFRIASEKNPSYTGKIVSALREQLGGHDVKD